MCDFFFLSINSLALVRQSSVGLSYARDGLEYFKGLVGVAGPSACQLRAARGPARFWDWVWGVGGGPTGVQLSPQQRHSY